MCIYISFGLDRFHGFSSKSIKMISSLHGPKINYDFGLTKFQQVFTVFTNIYKNMSRGGVHALQYNTIST